VLYHYVKSAPVSAAVSAVGFDRASAYAAPAKNKKIKQKSANESECFAYVFVGRAPF
jgi:hypothetical protein